MTAAYISASQAGPATSQTSHAAMNVIAGHFANVSIAAIDQLRRFARSGTDTNTGTDGDAAQPAGHDQFKPAIGFCDLPGSKAIRKQRDIATAMGLANPFFRSHDAAIGATTRMDGRHFINFASYDYLGLNQDARVANAAKDAINQYGTSVSASRVVAGERPLHRALERAIASFYGVDDSIVFVSGHATNVSTIAALMGPDDLVVHDELMHNSALVGAKLSRATTISFRHNDLAALERVLQENRSKHRNALIVVEGLYSMDGDFPDLPRLIELKQRFGAWLMVDEAHSLGVLGKTGHGVAEHFNVDPRAVDIWMGTLSKTLSGCGGYIAGTTALVELLKYQAPGFVYSVGLSPPATAGSLAALEILQAEPERVAKLQANGALFLAEAKAAGLDTATSAGYSVVPVMIGCSVKAVRLTERLLARGVNALPIIHPAVPVKGARLRFFITSEHTPKQIKAVVQILREELDRINAERVPVSKLVKAMMVT